LRTGALQDRYGDRTALGRMASSPSNPEPELPPTAAQADPAPPDPGPCPTCGRARPNLVNTWATGDQGHPSLRVPLKED
jgi:hypothetical protein